jgi:hypothetical protein
VTISIEGLGEIPEVSDEIINDLDRPATIDDIEYSGAISRGMSFRSMLSWEAASGATFDRDRLKAALVRARALRVNEDIIEGAADWICDAWYTLCRHSETGPSKKLLDIHKALVEWVGDQSWEAFELSMCLAGPGDESPRDVFARLTQAVGRLIKERNSRKPKGNHQKSTTTFQVRLYGLYIAVSGKRGLKDGSYAHCFVRDCAALVGVHLPKSGFTSLINQAIKREKVQK